MPTIKQKKSFKEFGVNGGNLTKAMRVGGYSKEVAKRTDKLTKTKGWKELMDTYLPDSELARVHKEGLEATKTFSSHTEPDKTEPDYATRHKYLDSAYKIKKKYPQEKDANVNLNFTKIEIETNIKMLADKVADEALKEQIKKLNGTDR